MRTERGFRPGGFLALLALAIHMGFAATGLDVLFNLYYGGPALDNLRFVLPPALTTGLLAVSVFLTAGALAISIPADHADAHFGRLIGMWFSILFMAAIVECFVVVPALRLELPPILTLSCLIAAALMHIGLSRGRLRRTQFPRLWGVFVGALYFAGALNMLCWFHIIRIESAWGTEFSRWVERAAFVSGGTVLAAVLFGVLVATGTRLSTRGWKSRRLIEILASAFPYLLLGAGLSLWSYRHAGRFHESGVVWPVILLCAAAVAAIVLTSARRGRHWPVNATAALALTAVVGGLGGNAVAENFRYQQAFNGIRRVILITSDTLRSDALSCYGGSDIATPALDEFARDAVLFENAYSVSSWTMPSFASIMTGQPSSVFGPFHYQARLPASAVTLAERFAARGALTGAVGTNQLLRHRHGYHQGFRHFEFYPRPRRPRTLGGRLLHALWPDFFLTYANTEQLHDRAIRWLSTHRDKSFFFWLHFFDPHWPFTPPEKYRPEGNVPRDLAQMEVAGLSPSEKRDYWEYYLAEVRYVDEFFGRTIRFLKEADLYDSSLIIFTSDHGEEFWEHGGFGHDRTLYNESIRVPLMVKLPHQERTGRVEAPVSGISLTPTILDLLGINDDPASFEGPSLAPLLLGDQSVETLPLFASGPQRPDHIHKRSVRFGDYKMIVGVDKSLELYNEAADPAETRDLQARHPDRVHQGLELLEAERDRVQRLREKGQGRGSGQIEMTPKEKRHLEAMGYL